MVRAICQSPRRARLLRPAAQTKSAGGNPGAQPAGDATPTAARHRRGPDGFRAVPQRRHGGVYLRRRPRRLLFLEVNTRLQVEHGVTEQVWGVDLVNWMIRQAAGELDLAFEHSQLRPQGHAVQARIYAEAPHLDFRPSSGRPHPCALARGRRHTPAHRHLGGGRYTSARPLIP